MSTTKLEVGKYFNVCPFIDRRHKKIQTKLQIQLYATFRNLYKLFSLKNNLTAEQLAEEALCEALKLSMFEYPKKHAIIIIKNNPMLLVQYTHYGRL